MLMFDASTYVDDFYLPSDNSEFDELTLFLPSVDFEPVKSKPDAIVQTIFSVHLVWYALIYPSDSDPLPMLMMYSGTCSGPSFCATRGQACVQPKSAGVVPLQIAGVEDQMTGPARMCIVRFSRPFPSFMRKSYFRWEECWKFG